ncbi:MAG: T9SS type A sorting domain-containing protein [Ekhidna sp.]|nr:T9SS type A sorting domain-containing protein [Ekhidna sp.]
MTHSIKHLFILFSVSARLLLVTNISLGQDFVLDTEPVSFSDQELPLSIDLTGDGTLDSIKSFCIDCDSPEVKILINDGSGNFTEPRQILFPTLDAYVPDNEPIFSDYDTDFFDTDPSGIYYRYSGFLFVDYNDDKKADLIVRRERIELTFRKVILSLSEGERTVFEFSSEGLLGEFLIFLNKYQSPTDQDTETTNQPSDPKVETPEESIVLSTHSANPNIMLVKNREAGTFSISGIPNADIKNVWIITLNGTVAKHYTGAASYNLVGLLSGIYVVVVEDSNNTRQTIGKITK